MQHHLTSFLLLLLPSLILGQSPLYPLQPPPSTLQCATETTAPSYPSTYNATALLTCTNATRPEKICIVGAGASGIHLAWLLRRRGFNNTVIFEQRDRIGGYVWTDNAHPQDNITRELGAAFLSPDYDEVRGLLKRFNLSEVPISVSKGMDFHHNGTTTSASTWYSSWVYNISGIREPTLQQDAIQAALSKYNALHVSMFGNYTGKITAPQRREPLTTTVPCFPTDSILCSRRCCLLFAVCLLCAALLLYPHTQDVFHRDPTTCPC